MRVKQIVFKDLGVVDVEETEESPVAGPGQVLLAPAFLGICGSDLHVLEGKHPWIRPPLVTGHEVSAQVLAVGEGVTRVNIGDHVVVNPLVPCGQCARCASGTFNQCEAAKVLGFRLPGAARSSFVIGEAQLHRIPPSFPLHLASLTEPLAVGVHAARRWSGLSEVLIIGGGTVGLSLLLALRARGVARITLVEPTGSKRELAARLGATDTLHPDQLGTAARFTASFDCVGVQATLNAACACTLAGGAVIAVGVPAHELSIPLPRMQRFEISVIGSAMYLPADIDDAIALLASAKIDAQPLVSAIYPLSRVADSYRAARNPENVKVLIDFSA